MKKAVRRTAPGCFRLRTAMAAGVLMGASLSAAGMPVRPFVDGDGDRVDDSVDQCLYSAPGAVVDAHGCSRDNDQDADGVRDSVDDCPYTLQGARVDAHGCALDDDFDGVADGLDRCPQSAYAAVVDAQGCAPGQRPSSPPAVLAATRSVPVTAAPGPAAARTVAAAPGPAAARTVAAPAPSARAPGIAAPATLPAVPAGTALVTVYYEPGREALADDEVDRLRVRLPQIQAELQRRPGRGIVVVAHAQIGENGAPEALTDVRARRVSRYLIARGIDPARIRVVRAVPAADFRERRVDVFADD